MLGVECPLCGRRRARRACPALEKQICAVCCGTKRLAQIHCPSDCPYLASARDHPAAVVVRQQQRDFGLVVPFIRELTDRQSQIFILVGRFLSAYQLPELHALIDEDVAEAAGALAGTLETSSRGVIYEHRPQSLPAGRLADALKIMLTEAGGHDATTSAFERDAAVVLRRIEDAARGLRAPDASHRREFLDLLTRVLRAADPAAVPAPAAGEGRLIIS